MRYDAGDAWKAYRRAFIKSRKMDGIDSEWSKARRRAFVAGFRAAMRLYRIRVV